MDKILVLGAGKSSGVLIEYLASHSASLGYVLKVADSSVQNLNERVSRFPNVEQFCGNLEDTVCLNSLISEAKIVVSLLPPFMHIRVAKICIEYSKHLLTASYISSEMSELNNLVKHKELVFMMECGLDPGLDHMSAMQILDNLKASGAKITAFYSYCGGLVAPESNDNPWGYKVTWNPRNVVLAGTGTAQYLENGKQKFVPYHQLFKHTSRLKFEEYGEYEAYPNRDSISYIEKYGLQDVNTFLRGTIRNKGFCTAWDQLVQLGLTDDSIRFKNANKMKVKEMFECFLPENKSLTNYLNLDSESEEYKKLVWLGCNSEELLAVNENASPAECLQKLIEDKWKLKEGDKDLVLMQHQIEYIEKGYSKRTTSSLAIKGHDTIDTAMARTVGLPLGIATLLIWEGKISTKGVISPVIKEIYNPILKELQSKGLIFREYSHS